jgi:hypothetical protein
MARRLWATTAPPYEALSPRPRALTRACLFAALRKGSANRPNTLDPAPKPEVHPWT